MRSIEYLPHMHKGRHLNPQKSLQLVFETQSWKPSLQSSGYDHSAHSLDAPVGREGPPRPSYPVNLISCKISAYSKRAVQADCIQKATSCRQYHLSITRGLKSVFLFLPWEPVDMNAAMVWLNARVKIWGSGKGQGEGKPLFGLHSVSGAKSVC